MDQNSLHTNSAMILLIHIFQALLGMRSYFIVKSPQRAYERLELVTNSQSLELDRFGSTILCHHLFITMRFLWNCICTPSRS